MASLRRRTHPDSGSILGIGIKYDVFKQRCMALPPLPVVSAVGILTVVVLLILLDWGGFRFTLTLNRVGDLELTARNENE